jgi:hypothetical protein
MTRMSHQMICLGRYPDALQLLDVAARIAPARSLGDHRARGTRVVERAAVDLALKLGERS